MSIARLPYPSNWLPYIHELRGYANPFRLWEYCWAYWETCGPSMYLKVGDFGSGGFGFAQFLKARNQIVTVVDPILVNMTNENTEVHACRAHEYKGEPFDVIVCISVLEHMTDEELYLFAEVLSKFLKPGGCAVFTCDLHLNKPEGQGEEEFGKNRSYKQFIEKTGLSLRPLRESIPGFEGFSVENLNSDPSVLVSDWCGVPLTAQGFILEKPKTKLHGLLCTMNEVDVMQQWLDEELPYFDQFVAIDNSSDGTREILEGAGICILKQEELQYEGPACNDIRQFGQDKLRELGVLDGDWIHMCHADEFFIHDPRIVVSWAEIYKSEIVWWNSPFFIPTLEEGEKCFDESLSIHDRFLYYTLHQWQKFDQFFQEVRTYKLRSDTIHFDLNFAWPYPLTSYSEHCHTLPFRPTFKHFGYRSLKHCESKVLHDGHLRKKEERWGGIKWPLRVVEDLYKLGQYNTPRKYKRSDFQLPKWYEIAGLQGNYEI